jgi:hypothetical protein
MNIKHIVCAAMVSFTVAFTLPAAHADKYPFTPKPYTCSIVYTNGKPATDATLVDDLVNLITNAVNSASYKADKHGHVRLTPAMKQMDMEVQYCTSPTGFGFMQGIPDGESTSTPTFMLYPITRLRVHFVDQNRKPLPNLKVSVQGLTRGTGMSTTGIDWSDKIPGVWTQTTDIHGCATFKHLPQGFSLTTSTEDIHHSLSALTKPILLSQSPITPDATIQVIPAAVVSGIVMDGATNTPLEGITVEAKGSKDSAIARSDKNGRFTIGQLSPGEYRVAQVVGLETIDVGQPDYHANAIPDWISDPQQVEIHSAADATGVVLHLFRGGLITGKVTDTKSGAPLAGVQVNALPADAQAPKILRDISSAVTGTDGSYSLRVSPGKVIVTLQPTSKTTDSQPQSQIEILEGQAKTVDLHVNGSTYPVPGPTVTTHGVEAYANSEIVVSSVASTDMLPPDNYVPEATSKMPIHRSASYKKQRHAMKRSHSVK